MKPPNFYHEIFKNSLLIINTLARPIDNQRVSSGGTFYSMGVLTKKKTGPVI